MSLPYPIIGNFTGSINSGSFLNEKDTALFYVSQSKDVWFGFSQNDVIEISTFNTDNDDLIKWAPIGQSNTFKNINITYLDRLNVIKQFSYKDLVRDFIQFKNESILVNPIQDLNTIGITEGSFK